MSAAWNASGKVWVGGEEVGCWSEGCRDWATSSRWCCITKFSLIGVMVHVSLEEWLRAGGLLAAKMATVGMAWKKTDSYITCTCISVKYGNDAYHVNNGIPSTVTKTTKYRNACAHPFLDLGNPVVRCWQHAYVCLSVPDNTCGRLTVLSLKLEHTHRHLEVPPQKALQKVTKCLPFIQHFYSYRNCWR